MFERTLVKEMYYLWRVIMPLYRPAITIILNYSKRISDVAPFRLTRSQLSETAVHIAASMSPGHLSYLRKVKGPRGVLEARQLDGRQYYGEFQDGPCLDPLHGWECA